MAPNHNHSFEIRVSGWLADNWAVHFEGLNVQHTADGHTTIHGTVPDEAALFGVLRSIEGLGLSLVSVVAFPKGDAR
jgi:hypothetical protein